VLADDSVLLREGVARLLVDAGFEVVGQVDNAEDLVRRVGFSEAGCGDRGYPDAADAYR
jgi:DNA-binding NarL/FixJ family response regulator